MKDFFQDKKDSRLKRKLNINAEINLKDFIL